MKPIKLFPILIAMVILVACSTTKKNKSTATPSASVPETASTESTAPSAPTIKPLNGIYAPGEEELNVMKMKYSDITLETLKEGHSLYIGTCTNCHQANNIYRYSETEWTSIIEDMAAKANLKPAEKNAVYKYVLSIKATQL